MLVWVAMACVLALTLGVWFLVREADRERSEARCQALAEAIEERIRGRMTGLGEMLQGAAGYMARGSLPTRSEWRDYVERYHLGATYPGIQGMGFIQWIPPGALSTHVAQVRREGFPDYEVTAGNDLPRDPEGFAPVVYLEPLDARNRRALGKDLWSEPLRREALARARDTGEVAVTGKLKLYQETLTDVQAGVLLVAPVYCYGAPVGTVAQRRQALQGWVYYPFRMVDLVRATLKTELQDADLDLYDGSALEPAALLFDAASGRSRNSGPIQDARRLELAGRLWTIVLKPRDAFLAPVGSHRPWEVLLAGGLASLGVGLLLLFMAKAERRAWRLAEQRGTDLLATESRFRAFFEKAPFGMAIMESDTGRFLSVNPRLGEILGRSVADLEGRTFQSVTHPAHVEADTGSVRALVDGVQAEITKEKRYLHADGHEVWVRISLKTLPTAEGEPRRHLAIIEDISEARARDQALLASETRFRSTFDLSPDAITLGRLVDGAILAANPAWCTLTGIPLEEALGHSALALGAWPDPAERQWIMTELQARGRIHNLEVGLCSRDGSQHRVRISATIIEVQGERLILVIGRDVTAEVATQQALLESETRCMFALEGARAGVWDWSAEPSRVETREHYNDRYKTMLGYGPDEDLGSDLADWLGRIHPEDQPGVLEAMEAYQKGQSSTYQLRFRIRRKDGAYIWIESRGLGVAWDAQGRLVRMIGTHIDITDQVDHEAALRASQARFMALVELSPDAVTLMRFADGTYQHLNRAWEVQFGYSRTEALGRTSAELGLFAHPEDRVALFERLSQEGVLPLTTLELIRKDGSRFLAELHCRAVELDGERHFLTVMRDVTAKVGLERAIQASERRFRQVVERATDAIYLHDETGRFLLCNPEASRMTGYAPDELLSMKVIDLDPEYTVHRDKAIWQEMKPAEMVEILSTHQRKSGARFPVEIHLGLLQEQPRQFLAMVRDLSEREQAQTAELRARKAESLVLMAGGVAHDFNNLFQALQGFLDLAWLQARADERIQNSVRLAQGVLQRAVSLSWKMLDFSRGGLFRMEEVDLGAVLQGLQPALQEKLGGTHCLELDIEPTPRVSLQMEKLKQVLEAMLENAVEAMGDTPGRVFIRLYVAFGDERRQPQSGLWPLALPDLPASVCLEIADEGPGVPAEILERICDPFFTTKAPGRGLGLAATVGLLASHRAGFHLFTGPSGGLVLRCHFPPLGL